MPTLTGAEETLLRTDGHAFKEYLAVLQPATILACQLDGAPASDPATEISYDNVTEGAFANVVAGMTLWVGSTAGGRDIGTCRIRKAAGAATLYIGEDSAVDWTDDDYLTVVENYELWMKYPRIVVNGSLTFYKDWEEAYTDQHENWPPVAIMGPPEAQFIDSGLATSLFVGEHSYAVAPGATLSSYAWVFPSGTPNSKATAGTDAAPHSITWDTAGTYWVTLTVTDDNGKTHISRRPVFIFDRTGANVPYTRFKIGSRSGDLNQHGHAVSFTVEGDADQAEFPDGALVVYFTEDWYGGTKQSIGGNYTGRAHVKFMGYIQKESTTKDPETSHVSFDAVSVTSLMDSREGFSCWIKNKGSVSNWTEATNLTADRAALSLIRHQSTLLDIADVIISGDTEYIKSQEFAAKTTLLQQLQTLYNDLFAHVAADKQGRVYFEIDPQMKPVADRAAIDVICDLGHGDWRDRLDLPRPQESKTSFINLAGVYYRGHPHEVEPILSKVPGQAPGYTGKTTEISGLILGGQADGNEKAGLALARENNEFPDVTLPMAGLWDVFDIVPQEYVRLSLVAGDTKRGIVWTDQKLIPRRVELSIEETKAGRVPKVTVHVEKDSFGPAGVDGDYPDEVPETSPSLMPTPSLPPLPPGGDGATGDGNTMYLIDYDSNQLIRTRNALAAAPDVVYELCGSPGNNPLFIALDPWDDVNGAIVVCERIVVRTTNLNDDTPTWAMIKEDTASDPKIWFNHIAGSICQQGLWLLCGHIQYVGLGRWYTRVWNTLDFGTVWGGGNPTGAESKYCKGELSSHDPTKGWIMYERTAATKRIKAGVSTDANALVGPTWALSNLFDNPSSPVVANPYHRYYENADDLVALWAGEEGSWGANVGRTQFCTADAGTCTETILGQLRPRWAGGYTWGTGGFWVLGSNLLYTSPDGTTWSLKHTFAVGTCHAISGFPYAELRLYGGMNHSTAPMRLSTDGGATFTPQTGNWAADIGITPDIRSLVPVWTEY